MMLSAASLQAFRFFVVGFTSNLVLYLLYLGLTRLGVGHKITMSFLYVVGVLQTFAFNKKWTFNYHGHRNMTLLRYISLYAVGYMINLGALIVMVDSYGYQHEWVQVVMIFVLAIFLFVGQKLWVFRLNEAAGSTPL